MSEFYCQKIKLKVGIQSGLPVSFLWEEPEYRIVKLESAWQYFGFSPPWPPRKGTVDTVTGIE